jgi:hypothetical protein
MKSISLLALAFLLVGPACAMADQDATYTGQLSASENAFVGEISTYLMVHYPTAGDAVKAGYIRYTGEDETGAISYANLHWQSTDIHHPSQLWYDKNGKLIGADYSVLLSGGPSRPQLWGVNPGRWVEFDGHIHWVGRDANGELKYDQWAWDKAFVTAGGDINAPKAATLVAMKKVTSANEVATIFHFPAIWDLIVWVTPNPNGAFAWKNPLVQP